MRARLAALSTLLVMLSVGGCGASGRHDGDGTIRLFAASSLTDVLEAMVDSFETTVQNGPHVSMNLAGSSLLARQVEYGADVDIFISAHPSWTRYLYQEGYLQKPSRLPITNRLVLVSRLEGQGIVDVERLALADPDHVPAGIYARGALVCDHMWTILEKRIAATVDVRAALAAVEEGAVDAAVVYRSDAFFTPDLHVSEPFTEPCQPQITYTLGLAPSARRGAEQLAAFLSDSLRASTWESFGFASRAVYSDSIQR